MMNPTISGWRRNLWPAALALIFITMTVNVEHPYLWGPDEPREAEIARESLLRGNMIVTTFNRIPYVEKPPLYYDLVAGAFRCRGGFEPGAARMVSAALGILMLLAIWGFARKKLGAFPALIAVAVCISLPQFYRSAHKILLDIGVGAFVTAALAIYGFLSPENRKDRGLHMLFFFCAAAAFLTKGTVTLVYLGAVILPYMAYKRRWIPCRLNWTLLFFLIPVGIWLWLFYREGGVYYLHEHFINNIFGRLLHKDLHLPGSPVTVNDVGIRAPWFFYLKRLPEMFGAAVVLIPLVLAESYRICGLPFFSFRLPPRVKRIWDFLTAPAREMSPEERDLRVYLLCWTFVPFLFFSLPAIKEVTYLLPSYAGLAILGAWYLTDRVRYADLSVGEILTCLVLPCVLFAASAQFVSPFSVRIYLAVCGGIYAGLALMLGVNIRRKIPAGILLTILAGLIGATIIGNTPAVMRTTRLNRKCYDELARAAWRAIGDRPLYMRGGDESIRGAMPFYGNRQVTILLSSEMLLKQLAVREPQAVMMVAKDFDRMKTSPKFAGHMAAYRIERLKFPGKSESFVLLLSEQEKRENTAVPSPTGKEKDAVPGMDR